MVENSRPVVTRDRPSIFTLNAKAPTGMTGWGLTEAGINLLALPAGARLS